jgi:Mechanosensitive ion channel
MGIIRGDVKQRSQQNSERAEPHWARIRMLPKQDIICALFVALLASLGGQQQRALSQQIPSFDAQARSQKVVGHLSSAIKFYRASIQPIQKAGEPNDVVYRDQAASLSSQAAELAFQSAKAEAVLIAKYQSSAAVSPNSSTTGEQQKIQDTEGSVEKQISDLRTNEAALDRELAAAAPQAIAALQARRKQVQDALDLENAMIDALQKIVGIAEAQGGIGLASDIDRLQRSVPELQSNNKIAVPQLVTLDSTRSSGVFSQGSVLFQLLETRHALDALVHDSDDLHRQALALRTPVGNILQDLVRQGQQLSQQAARAASSSSTTPQQKTFPDGVSSSPAQANIESITAEFKALLSTAVPLSQEIIVLEQSHSNLAAWQTSVVREYGSILHALLLRILVIGIALVLIFGGGEVWTRATNKYVRDIRRRRQFLLVRRAVAGFLSFIVILFGFVTQFNSLATFVGFITAGIAVGLQTILLSVAAYFFIIGRYGVKVGDRITISSVTGEVIEVGLVRFYLMELAGSGTEMNPTGRVAVFSNAVLFQAGTPLYKQMPGTEYAWHELTVKLSDTANYKAVCEAVMKEVHAVSDGYRTHIELQHQGVANWTPIDSPITESRVQFNGDGLRLWARFPVQIKNASETDEKLTQALLELMANNPEIKSGVASTPLIQASIKA